MLSVKIDSPVMSEQKAAKFVPVTTPKQSIAITEQIRRVDPYDE